MIEIDWRDRLIQKKRSPFLQGTRLVEEATDLAEARSASSCEICGEPGRLYGPGWLTTRCTLHAEGRTPTRRRRK
jgi:hypothetical protein